MTETRSLSGLCHDPEQPNPPLNSDPARTVLRSFSSFRFLGSARRLGAGGSG
jgi:hypothetical protein